MVQTAWQRYLSQGGRYQLLSDLISIGFIFSAGPICEQLGHHFPSVVLLAPLLKDPFTILSGLILVASYTDLHYMKFKLREHQPPIIFDLDPLEEQKVIPKRYEEVYGSDLFVKAWKIRLVIVLSFFVATVRWFFALKPSN
jgi:hypothetical protein